MTAVGQRGKRAELLTLGRRRSIAIEVKHHAFRVGNAH